MHPASVTNAVDRLETTGLVRRTPHPSDRRTTLAALTDAGRELATKATEALNADVFSSPGLPAEQVRTLVDVLATMRRGAGDF